MKEFFGSHETTTSKKVEPYIVWLKLWNTFQNINQA
jgi:hypothetical protein